ncbi:uncharacterized protein [Parasteatoda tepidariorum]|uniref:uncharacterized protein n=1 Tax=Parasteatoda tepidariorum TaxID=114398 RepID=UPI001C71A3C5|nr:uncharacterized protein LOC107445268 [Parasteatoda tepidariorum]
MEVKYKKVSFWRSKARFLFQILLAIGFTIQSVKFVEMYLQYPSSVELEVVQPSEVELPAFTVCNINEIRASSYCREYPQFCGTPETDSTFCTRFAEYCNLVNVSKEVPLRDKDSFRHLTRYQQQILGHQYSTLVSSCTIETDDEERNCSSTPILVPALSFSYEIPFNCWMIYSLHNKPYETPQKVPVSTKIHLILNLEVSEYHPSHLSRGAQLSIHSPFHVPSPVGEGLFLNMGTVYRIYIRLAIRKESPASTLQE